MCPAIDTPTSCEIRAVISFLHAKIMSAAEILREFFRCFLRSKCDEEL
jgi:hypothetical protein